MRKYSLLLIIGIVAIGIFGVRTYNQEPLYHSQSYVFGTLVDVSIYGETDERAKSLADHVMQDFQQLHYQLHAWKTLDNNQHQSNQPQSNEPNSHQSSEIVALNTAFSKGKTPITISPLLAGMLIDATNLSVKSQGLFNPAIGHLIGAWGFQQDEFSAVTIDDDNIKSLVKSDPRMTDIVVKNNTAYSNNPAVKLDLGGYAKGYALDRAADYLRQQHVKNALINIGGNIIALGQHGKNPWRVGLQHPRQPSAIATLDLPDGWAIGTSGDYQRYFMLNGKRYCHIIDPRTGYPVQHTQAVTVLIPPQALHQSQAGVLSDFASKPIFIAPADSKAKMASLLGVQYFMVIDQDANIFVTQKLAKKLNWLDNSTVAQHKINLL